MGGQSSSVTCVTQASSGLQEHCEEPHQREEETPRVLHLKTGAESKSDTLLAINSHMVPPNHKSNATTVCQHHHDTLSPHLPNPFILPDRGWVPPPQRDSTGTSCQKGTGRAFNAHSMLFYPLRPFGLYENSVSAGILCSPEGLARYILLE